MPKSGGVERHGRYTLVPQEHIKYRVDKDGVFAGYIQQQYPGSWWWLNVSAPRARRTGEARTKRQAIKAAAGD